MGSKGAQQAGVVGAATPSPTAISPTPTLSPPTVTPPRSSQTPDVSDTTTHITYVDVASGIDGNNNPLDQTSEFKPGQTVYIAYSFTTGMRPGQQVTYRVSRDGQPVFTASQVVGYKPVFEFTPAQAGNYTVEIYIGDATMPDKTASFTVCAYTGGGC